MNQPSSQTYARGMSLSDLLGPELFSSISSSSDLLIHDLCVDSRVVRDGSIFFALPGGKFDGRDYIEAAIERGASAIVSLSGLADMPIPYLAHHDPRHLLAKLSAKFYAGQPETMIAITGTNGKSSSVEFLRQIWASSGLLSACFGTLGVQTNAGHTPLTHTTPDAIALHQTLRELSDAGITHAAMEASSHGLIQSRLDGVVLSAVAFTNLTQDHFDYHSDMDDYFAAKSKLFTDLAPSGVPAIINVDGEYGHKAYALCEKIGLEVMSVGWSGADIRILEITPRAASQIVDLDVFGKRHRVDLPLLGEFQIYNAVTALGLAIKTGVKLEIGLAALESLTGVSGRMELIGTVDKNSPVIVDFAHTPDGLEKLLKGIRPHTTGRIVVVFGCGGDRDPSKRPKMGGIAEQYADVAIVTDDNPRFEDPALIRKAVLTACPSAVEIGNRAEAIHYGINQLRAGDCLVIAGKGHERGQSQNGKTLPFHDGEVARAILQKRAIMPIHKSRGA